MREIELTQGKVALVDEEDYARVSSYKWCYSVDGRGATGYALRWTRRGEKLRWKSQKIRLHHYVLDRAPHELPPGTIVEHKNQDSLDCRKSNLWLVNKDVNMLLSPNWKKRSSLELSTCAECGSPIMALEFLCNFCMFTRR